MNKREVNRLKADLRYVVDDIEHALQSAAGAAGDRAGVLKTRAADRTRAVAHRGNAYVHDNPWVLVGVAAAAAFAIGWLAHRRVSGRGNTAEDPLRPKNPGAAASSGAPRATEPSGT